MTSVATKIKSSKLRDPSDPYVWANVHHEQGSWTAWQREVGRQARSDCAFTLDEVAEVLRNIAAFPTISLFNHGYLPALWRAILAAVDPLELPAESRSSVEAVACALEVLRNAAEMRMARELRSALNTSTGIDLPEGEVWADHAKQLLEALPKEIRGRWVDLLLHCETAKGASPSRAWLATGRQRRSKIPIAMLREARAEWFGLFDKPRTHDALVDWRWQSNPALYVSDRGQALIRGLCWLCEGDSDARTARAIGGLALGSFKKVPGIGPRAVSVGNAAIWALGQIPGLDALGQLTMLRVKVKFIPAQKAIEKALTAAATREGLPRAEIEELGVPTYGLTAVGVRREELGDTIAELSASSGEVALRFFKKSPAKDNSKGTTPDGDVAKGKEIKSAPASVKKDFADDLKELKAAAKDLTSMLSAQRDRIDSMFLDNRSWPLAAWRTRYLDHPVIGVIARRVIWTVTSGGTRSSVLHHDGHLVDHRGARCEPAADSVVSLWHPVEAPTDEVLAWRCFIEERQIRQPFKQAHREVYLLTDAERRTNTYSNRFAAHMVRQHQFKALADQRNWRSKLRLMVDAEYPPPSRAIGAHHLRAEFWVEPVGDDYGTDTNESGAYHYLATDQVRFYDVRAAENSVHASGGAYAMGAEPGNQVNDPLSLEAIPPLVLSEILRDCDLFVGVASVGNNPQWQDGGPNNQFRDYWQTYSFGNLSATAETRRDLLSRLVPRLKIAERCSLSDRFLIVRGNIRTYKIHLGSGNILMEPNDQYLCIVPSSSGSVGGTKTASASGVFLPFEGDRTLSIILSKAFLLAADDAITDTTITRQIVR